jgi:hypothetical protein
MQVCLALAPPHIVAELALLAKLVQREVRASNTHIDDHIMCQVAMLR